MQSKYIKHMKANTSVKIHSLCRTYFKVHNSFNKVHYELLNISFLYYYLANEIQSWEDVKNMFSVCFVQSKHIWSPNKELSPNQTILSKIVFIQNTALPKSQSSIPTYSFNHTVLSKITALPKSHSSDKITQIYPKQKALIKIT